MFFTQRCRGGPFGRQNISLISQKLTQRLVIALCSLDSHTPEPFHFFLFMIITLFVQFNQSTTVTNWGNTSQACNFIIKETLTQVFSCEFCEISKNTFLYRTPLVAASVFLNSSTFMIGGFPTSRYQKISPCTLWTNYGHISGI